MSTQFLPYAKAYTDDGFRPLLQAPNVAEELERWRPDLDAMFVSALAERRCGALGASVGGHAGGSTDGQALNIGAFFDEIKKKKARPRPAEIEHAQVAS
jgi:hypothetical protein